MDAIEKRARDLLAAAYEADGMGGRAGEIRNPAQYMEKPDRRALGCIIAALTPPDGYVLAPVELPDMRDAPGFAEGRYSRTNWHAAIDDLQLLAARPEVL